MSNIGKSGIPEFYSGSIKHLFKIALLFILTLAVYGQTVSPGNVGVLLDQTFPIGSATSAPISIISGQFSGMSNLAIEWEPSYGSNITACTLAIDSHTSGWNFGGAIAPVSCPNAGNSSTTTAVVGDSVRADISASGVGSVRVRIIGTLSAGFNGGSPTNIDISQTDGTIAGIPGPAAFQVAVSTTGTLTAGVGGGITNSVGLDINQNCYATEWANDSNGTTLYKPVIWNSSLGGVETAAGTETDGIIGICMGQCGTTLSAQVCTFGAEQAVFAAGVTAGHWVQNGAGGAVDSGASTPPSSGGEILGKVTTTHGGAGTYAFQAITPRPIAPSGSFSAAGDLSGSSSSQEVIGLLSNALPSLTTGYLNWTGSAWALTAVAGSGANTALSNLSAVSINTSLLAQTGTDLGSAAHPFRSLYLFSNGTYGTTSFQVIGTPTAPRVWTLQDASDTFVGRATTDTLTNKSIAGSEVNSGTVGAQFGGTGLNSSASTGVPQVAAGTWTVSTTLPSGLSATNLTLVTPILGTPQSGTLTNATGLPLSGLTTQALDTVVMNATGSTASPTAVSLDSLGGTNSCAGATNALTWNSSTHAWGCNNISTSGLAFPVTVSGTANSGGIPYFSGTTTLTSSSTLTQYGSMYGGGAGAAPGIVAPPSTNGEYYNGYHVTGSAASAPLAVQFLASTTNAAGITITPTYSAATLKLEATASDIPIADVGSAGLSGTSPVTIASTGAIGCATCVTSGAALTSTAFMTGAGLQASQTPNNSSTLDSSGNASFAGTLAGKSSITLGTNGGTNGSVVINGSTSGSATINTSATGVLALPSGTTATNMVLTTPNLGTPSAGTLTNATGLPVGGIAAVAANTTLANVTSGSASPTAATIPSGIQNYVSGTGYNQATGHQLQVPLACPDSSGSGTTQVCSTGGTTYTPAAYDCIIYSTTTTNSGAGLTVNVDSLGAKSVAIAGASGWTTTLTASIIPANKPMLVCYDGTNWDVSQTGTAAGGGISGLTTGYVPKAISATAIGNSAVDDGITTASTVTIGSADTGGLAVTGGPVSTGAAPPTISGGTSGAFGCNEGTDPSAVSGADIFSCNATSHDVHLLVNGGVAKLVDSSIGYNSGSVSASIGSTQIAAAANFPTGQYTLSCDVVVTAVGSSPTLAVTIGWTDITGTARTKTCTTGVVTVSDNPVTQTITSNGSAAITVTQTLAVSTATWWTTVAITRLQ